MSEFLVGEELSDRIRDVVGGNGVKCAVAFWSDNRFEIATEQVRDWKIICDLSMGATSPDELRRFGAPENENLRYFTGLHSKVYISDRGVVVGSANASARALGLDGRPAFLLEAGTFHAKDTDVWKVASDWFMSVFGKSSQVDEDALEDADRRYRHPAIAAGTPLAGMTILQQIAAAPDYYEASGIGFVICGSMNDLEGRQEAARQALEIANDAGIDEERMLNWRAGYVFTGWGDLGNLSSRFVEFYLGPRGRRAVVRHEVVLRHHREGNFFTEPTDRTRPITTVAGVPFPSQLEPNDWAILEAIQEGDDVDDGAAIFTARTFSEALRRAYRG